MIPSMTTAGEEAQQKALWATDEITLPGTISMALYDDSTDQLDDTADDPSVLTEPSDGNYGRKTLAIDGSAMGDGSITVSASGGDWAAALPALSWDVTDTTGVVDAYVLVMQVQLDGDGSPAAHIITGGSLGQSYTLDGLDVLNTDAGGGTLLD